MRMNSDIERMLKNVIKSVSDVRPVLQCVHFQNGNAYVTDSYRLIRVRDIAPKGLNLDINLKDFSFPDNDYPEVDKLIGDQFSTVIVIPKAVIKDALPALRAMRPGYNAAIKIKVTEETMRITRKQLDSGISQSLSLNVENFIGAPIDISCDPRFLSEAFDAITRFKGLDIRLSFNSPLQPFVMTNENIDYLVTPVRVFE